MKYATLALLVLSSLNAFAAEAPAVVLDCRIGKFAAFQLQKDNAAPAPGYLLVEQEMDRDRAGPGIYLKDAHYLTATYNAEKTEITTPDSATTVYQWSFDGQGGASIVSLVAKSAANGQVTLSVGQGSGPVFESVSREWKQYVLDRKEDSQDAPKGSILCSKGE